MSPNNMIFSLLLNTPFKIHLPVTIIITAIVYAFSYLFIVLWIFLPTSGKRWILFRKLKVGHYRSTIPLKIGLLCVRHGQREWRANFKKLSSVLEFVARQRLQPHFSVILFYFLETWLKFQKHPKLGDKIVCSEITEFISLWAAALYNVELWMEPRRFNEQTKTMSLHVHFTPFRAYLTVESLSYYWDSLAWKISLCEIILLIKDFVRSGHG